MKKILEIAMMPVFYPRCILWIYLFVVLAQEAVIYSQHRLIGEVLSRTQRAIDITESCTRLLDENTQLLNRANEFLKQKK